MVAFLGINFSTTNAPPLIVTMYDQNNTRNAHKRRVIAHAPD